MREPCYNRRPHDQKQFGKERVYLSLQLSTQGRNLEIDTEAEAMEECCLLVSSLWLFQFALLYTPGPLDQGSTSHSNLGPLTSILNKETVPTDLLTD